jgi:hypothetical protein
MASKTIGPILATGAATVVNRSVFHGQPIDWRVPIATGLAAVGFDLFERVAPKVAQVLAWTTFLTVLLTRTDPSIPSPTESALTWWKKG